MTSFLLEKKINIPYELVNNIRNILFEIKTKYGMIPYESTKNFLFYNPKIYDIYTNEPKTMTKIKLYNIEHVILSSIITNRPAKIFENEIFINNEPYHDSHILFPTLKIINSLRSNYIYGDIKESGFHFNKAIYPDTIQNIKDNMFADENVIDINITSRTEIPENPEKPENYDTNSNIYIDDDCKYSKISDKTGIPFTKCNIGECIFEPKEETSGTIARIVFYYFLMYAINPTVRPFTNDNPWLVYNINQNKKKNICFGLNFDEWKKFFYDKFYYYYYCAKKYPATKQEHDRNIEIINFTGVPNVFIGYINKDGEYIINTFKIIDELFGFEEINDISELFQVIVNCKTEGIETNKIFGSSFDYSKNKYLLGNTKTNILTCSNHDFYKNIIDNQLELLDNIQVYFINSLYNETFDYILNLLNEITPIFNNQPKLKKILTYYEQLENNKFELEKLAEKVSKKIKSILDDVLIYQKLYNIYLEIFNEIYIFNNFLKTSIKTKKQSIKSPKISTANKKKSNDTIKILEQQSNILESIIKKYKSPDEFKSSFTELIVVECRKNSIVNIPTEHECSIYEETREQSPSPVFYKKYIKYKNKYLQLKYNLSI
jgi:endonuclease I